MHFRRVFVQRRTKIDRFWLEEKVKSNWFSLFSMQAPIHQSKSDVFSNVTASPARPIVQFQQENQEPSTPTSIKRKQVLINEKNTSILQRWDQKLRLSNDRMEVSILSSFVFVQKKNKKPNKSFPFRGFYAQRNGECQTFEKRRRKNHRGNEHFRWSIQRESSIDSRRKSTSHQFDDRSSWNESKSKEIFLFFSFFVHSANSSNFGAVDALQRRSTDDERRFLRRNERKNDERNQNEFSFHSFRTLFFFPLWRRNVTSSTTSPLKNTLRPSNFFVRAIWSWRNITICSETNWKRIRSTWKTNFFRHKKISRSF